jgi:hypothetical protein
MADVQRGGDLCGCGVPVVACPVGVFPGVAATLEFGDGGVLAGVGGVVSNTCSILDRPPTRRADRQSPNLEC